MADRHQEKDEQYKQDIVAAFAERTVFRLWALVILLIVVVGLESAYIIWEKEVYDTTITETYTSESDDGGIAIVNRDGEVNYGESNLYEDTETNP